MQSTNSKAITLNNTQTLKWPEVYSLAALNAAVVISWIAYHEYQPTLIQKFDFHSLAEFLVGAKAIILIIIPVFAGYLADRMMNKNGKYFIIYTVGIGATAMIFMTVATIIAAGPLSAIKPALPIMIVLWLIAMNLFISPANSMIEAFAPAQQLPKVMGVLFLVTELIYSLEPLVVELVHFFGETLTFIVGGILISTTGFIFHKVSSDEVIQRKKEQSEHKSDKLLLPAVVAIILVGMELGIGKAFLTEFVPSHFNDHFAELKGYAEYISFGLLGLSAIIAFIISRYSQKLNITKTIIVSFITLVVAALLLLFVSNYIIAVFAAFVVAVSFSFVNISGLPYVFKNIPSKYITYGVGLFIGASEIFTGLFEYYFH